MKKILANEQSKHLKLYFLLNASLSITVSYDNALLW